MSPCPIRFTRRAAIRVAAGAAATTAIERTLSAQAGLTQPRPADSLVDAFGVVTHVHFDGTAYADHTAVLSWLKRLGVRHVRNRVTTDPAVLDAFAAMAEAGIGLQAVCGRLGDPQPMRELLDALAARVRPDSITALEAINEPNNQGRTWVAETRDKTRELHDARAAAGLTAVPLVAPALARVDAGGVEGASTREQARSLGDLRPWVDYGNIHVYSRGWQPTVDLAYFTQCAREVTGDLPIVCSETGYFTAADYRGPAEAVPLRVAGAYGPQALMEHLWAGERRMFRYELFDEPGVSTYDREASFGMVLPVDEGVTTTYFPKPDFAPMQRLLRLFADPGPPFRPQRLEIRLLDQPPDLKRLVFARRDGRVLICLWRDTPVYDPEKHVMTDQGRHDHVSIGLDRPREATVHRLTSGTSESFDPEARHAISLDPGVTVVSLGT